LLSFVFSCTSNHPFSTALPQQKFLRDAQQEAAFQIDTLINGAPTDMGWWGVKILYPNSGEIIYERNAEKMFMPASNMKLYTTAAALCLLGPQYRYATDFVATGEIQDGVLKGDLIIRGSGDPTWSWRFYDNNYDSVMVRFTDSLLSKGIRAIEGNVIGDDNIFDDELLGNGWMWDDEPYYFSAQISGLSYNENYIDFKLIPDSLNPGAPVIIESFPRTTYLNLRNDLLTVSSDTATTWDYGREWRSNQGWFEGDYPLYNGDRKRAITIHNPTLFTTHVLKERLEESGIKVSGNPLDSDDLTDSIDYKATNHLFTYYSHPLSEIVHKVNKPSQNFIAEALQRTLGARYGREGSSSEGITTQMALFDSLGMTTENLQLRDGSGLSRYNLVSPNTTASLLQMMWDHPYRTYFMASLPLSGASGTIDKRMSGMTGEFNVRAKTGSVSYVRSLSGYTWTQSGEPIIFAIMVNHYTIPTYIVNRIQDKIASILSEME
jgi:D-alanyl-D-alanine carboxypeptidase/D-alanyl-D-alanine-endopeptidase (penicillin-binding protein 4)